MVEYISFRARTRRQTSQGLERSEVLGATVRVAGVVQSIHPDEDIMQSPVFTPGERVREKYCIPRRNVRFRNRTVTELLGATIFRHFDREIRQRGAAGWKRLQLDNFVCDKLQIFGETAGMLDLDGVTLSVGKRQSVEPIRAGSRDQTGHRRVKSAADEHECCSIIT